MEVGLMLTIIAASESAVFIEPIQIKKKRYVSIYAILFKGKNTNKTDLFHLKNIIKIYGIKIERIKQSL